MKRVLPLLVVGCGLFVGQSAFAEDPAPNTGALSLTAGADYVTSYFFRGYKQEDSGLIVQPYATVAVKAFSNDALTITPNLGIWNSVHEEHTGTTGSNQSWYESDVFGGVDFGFKGFTLGAIYTFYTYPNGAFKTVEEFGVRLGYDDTSLMKKIGSPCGLKPYLAWYWEVDDGNGEEDQYAEVGISPAFAIPKTPVTFCIPLALGISPEGYYLDNDGHNEALGFFSAGVTAAMPLPVPSRFGTWTLSGGVTYIHLLADSAKAANDDNDSDWIGRVGISVSY